MPGTSDERGVTVDGGTTTVLTAVGEEPWAAHLLESVQSRALGLVLVRRCPDVEDLLVTAATGAARAVLVSPYTRVDRDVLARLTAQGLAVVGVVPALDEQGERRLRQLGVQHVHADHEGVDHLVAVVQRAVAAAEPGNGFANPFAAVPVPTPAPAQGDAAPGAGRVVAVWGPTGAPGRSTVAAGLAGELALLGWPTLLVDADVYGGTLAPALGLSDEVSGLASACRLANRGALDVPALTGLLAPVVPGLSLLTGLANAQRWPELRPSAVEVVLELARTLAAVTVVDCGFSLEQDEELSYDTLAPRRNGATLAVLERADLVVVVGGADPLGVRRLVLGLGELAAALPEARTTVVVNRLRGAGDAEVRAALRRFAGVEQLTALPLDLAATDAALDAARLLRQVAPASPLRLALKAFAGSLVARRADAEVSG